MKQLLCALMLLLTLWTSHATAALDPVENFAKVTVSQGYDSVATTIVVTTGQGARLPSATPFSLVWWNSTDYGDPSDDPAREIIRVTNRSGDTLTVLRAQEGTSATAHNSAGKTYRLVQGLTKAMWGQITSEIAAGSGGAIAGVSDVASYSDFATAVSTSCASTHTLRISTSVTVTANTYVPASCTLWIIGTGAITINASVTLTVDSPEQLRASKRSRLFFGAGSAVFLRPGVVSPHWFGAVANGSTDDGLAIQAAHDALPSTGGTLEFQPGSYAQNSELLILKNDVTVRYLAGTTIDITGMSGSGSTDIHDTAEVLAAVKVSPSIARVRVIGGRITGTPTASGRHRVGVLCVGCPDLKIGGTKIDGLYAGIWAGGGASNLTIQNVEVSGCSRNIVFGFFPDDSSSPQVDGAALINVYAHHATVGDGLQLYSYVSGVTVLAGRYTGNAGAGINAYVGGSYISVQNVEASANQQHGITATYGALSGTTTSKLGYARRLSVSGSRLRANGADGLSIQLEDYSLFPTIGGIEDVVIDDNLAEGNTGDGFDLGLVRSTVAHNRSLNNAGNCFTFRSSQQVRITGNHAWDCGTVGSNRRGFEFLTAATTGGTPPNNTLLSLTGNHAGDTRSGGSRTMNVGFDLSKLDTSTASENISSNTTSVGWANLSGSNLALLNNRGTTGGADVLGVPIGRHLRGTTTWNPPLLAAGDTSGTTLSVPGASVGDAVTCGHTAITADLIQFGCYVSAADTVRIVLRNITGADLDLASGTLAAEVWKP